MRITGSPGSYGPVRLGNPYVCVIRGMPVRNWTSCDVLVTCKWVVYGFSTGFLQFRDDVLAKGSQEPVRLPYGACTGPYGACASTVWTRMCLRTPVEFYDHCTWPVRVPVMAVNAHTSSWPRTTAYVPSTGKKRCACTTFRHRLLTGIRGLYGLKKTRISGSVRWRYVLCHPIFHISFKSWIPPEHIDVYYSVIQK